MKPNQIALALFAAVIGVGALLSVIITQNPVTNIATVPPQTQVAQVTQSVTMGETSTNLTQQDDHGDANHLIGQQFTLGQTATVQSLSFYVTTPSGKLRLGIYDTSGAKVAETNEITPVSGWNTSPVTARSLTAGTYWLTYLTNSNNLYFPWSTSGSYKSASFTYGTMPATFPSSTGGTGHAAIYATLNVTTTPSTPPAPTYPPQVSGVSVHTVSSTGATITWTTNIPSDTQVYYGLIQSFGSNTTLDPTLSTSHSVTLTGLIPNTHYYFQVRSTASNQTGTIAQQFTTSQSATPAITSFTATPTPSQRSQTVVLTWTTSGGIVSCNIEAIGNNFLQKIFGSTLGIVKGANDSITVTVPSTLGVLGDRMGTTGYVQLGCYTTQLPNITGTYVYKTVPIVIPPASTDTQAPTRPTNLTATAVSSTQINLSWNPSTDNSGGTVKYTLYKNGVSYDPNITGTTFQNTNLTPNTTYSYTVSARDTANNESLQSSSVSATTQSTVTPPPTATLSANPTSVTSGSPSTLTWVSTNATACTATGGTFAGAKAISGSVSTGNLTQTTTYGISCSNATGVTSAVVNATVTVGSSPNFALTTTILGTGSGTVTCGAISCSSIPSGTNVTVTATAASNSTVTGLDVNGIAATCALNATTCTKSAVISAAGTITAVFTSNIIGAGCTGTCRYITPNGTGGGTSWTDAASWNTNFARGATYYIAGGSYSGKTFNTAPSATTYVNIVKATQANSGSVSGWQASYGNQATFSGTLSFTTNYWNIDGVTGGGHGNWKGASTPFGFKINVTTSSSGSGILLGVDGLNHFNFAHIEIAGYWGLPSVYNHAVETWPNASDLTVRYAYFHDMGNCLFRVSSSNLFVEYLYGGKFGRASAIDSSVHTELASIWQGLLVNGGPAGGVAVNNITFANSIFTWMESTGGLMLGGDSFKIYGNVFTNGNTGWQGSDGAVGGWTNRQNSNFKVYNNSFIGILNVFGLIGDRSTGNVAYNNIFYNSSGINPQMFDSQGYNHFVGYYPGKPYTVPSQTGATTGTTNPFKDITNEDFTLVANTAAGIVAGAPTTDPTGAARTTMTRGAYEYTGSVSPTTYTLTATAGSNGTISPVGVTTVNSGKSQTYTITPAGGYQVSSVTVDGVSVGAVTSYIFSNVIANHTITATFSAVVAGGACPTTTCYYIRSGSSGNGSSWSNAAGNLPGTLTRGTTYYLADGSYGAHTFADNASGSTYIYIKKATDADHGNGAGWVSSYGVGQAVFSSLSFQPASSGNSGYYDFNGYSATATHNAGIKVVFGNGSIGINYWASGNHPYNSFKYMEIAGPAGASAYPYLTTPDTLGMWINANSAAGNTSHMLVSHCYFHGMATAIQDSNTGGNDYMTVEYSEFADLSSSNAGNHDNIWWLGSSYAIFRYNVSHNFSAEGIFLGWAPGMSHTGVEIYGNLFYDGIGSARGVEFREADSGSAAPFTNIKIYNNTFVDLPQASVRVMANSSTSGIDIKNNISVNTGGIYFENGGSGITQATNLTTTTSVFKSFASRDFHLAAPTTSGTTLASLYSTDMDGITRGTGGVWDIGAYEYTGTQGGDTQAPTVTTFTIPSTSSSLTVPITTFTATDNINVTGYMVTTTATAPTSSASGWTSTAPTSYTVSANGTYTLYAWAKDAAGNVSLSKSANVTVTISVSSCTGRCFYIDYATGSNANNGTSKSTPWKLAPGMVGFTGSYTHQAGDKFIFKGGVTWPAAALPLTVAYSGSSDTVRDYYGVDQTWYTGTSWVKPVFDGNYLVSSIFSLGSLSYITIDGLELSHVSTGSIDGTGLISGGSPSYITISNCYLHGWKTTASSDGAHGGVIFTSTASNQSTDLIDNCEISNAENSSRWNGVMVRAVGSIKNSILHDNSSAVLFTLDYDHNTMYNISNPNGGFDPNYHTNGVYLDAMTMGANVGYIRNSIFHDVNYGANMAYLNGRGATLYAYNNIFYGQISSQGAIEIDPYDYGANQTSGVYKIFNNTAYILSNTPLVHVVNRAGSPQPSSIVIENNHVIGTSVYTDDNGPSAGYTRKNNLVQTLSVASGQGYTQASLWIPTISTGGTIDAGYSPDATFFAKDIIGTTRPQGSAWDIGAYEYTGSTLAPVTYSITATAGSNGTISPVGVTTVNSGKSQTYTITPAGGYQVSSVTVDGVSVGAVTSYTFSNVVTNHAISATFTLSGGGTSGCTGTCYYITPSGAGLKNGSDWSNAYAGWPTFSRGTSGTTYYLADGTYGRKTLDTPANGTQTISIVKAIGATGQSGHGTDIGWNQTTMGTGQANIDGFDVNTSYWTIDGQKGAGFSVLPPDNNGADYGINFTNRYAVFNVGTTGDGLQLTNISISHVYAATDVTVPNTAGGGHFFAEYSAGYTNESVSNLTISHSYFYGWGQALVMAGRSTWSNVTWEYNVYEQMYTSQTYNFHGNPINALWSPATNLIVRYSLFYGTYGDGGLSEVISANGSQITNSKIYGNVFDQGWTGRAIIGGNGQVASGLAAISNSYIYNNTFLNSALGKPQPGGGLAGVDSGSGNTFVNNLAYSANATVSSVASGGEHHNEYIYTTNTPSGTGDVVISANTSPFIDWTTKNYALTGNTTAGATLGSEYGYDARGRARTTWTRGAFEY